MKAVREVRADYPTWGKAKITTVLRRQGRLQEHPHPQEALNKGAVSPSPLCDAKHPRQATAQRTQTQTHTPGEIVQLDTLTPGHGRPTVKQFTAPVAKWTCA